jgi:hypothetical protein
MFDRLSYRAASALAVLALAAPLTLSGGGARRRQLIVDGKF